MTLGDGTSRGQVSGVSGVSGPSEVERLTEELALARKQIDEMNRDLALADSFAETVRVREELLRRDLDAVAGRLGNVQRWTRLTEDQRTAVVQARNRAVMARERLGP